jgi:lactate permease
MMNIQTLLSFFPILLLIWLMTKKNALPSSRALPLTALVAYALMLVVFQRNPNEVHANVLDGLLTAWTPTLIIWGAIFLFRTMEASGAMTSIRSWLNTVTPNKVGQLMIVGWAFPFLIEGASGFGTPAALAAPVLVGLGFPPLRVAIMVLIMNSVPVSFGAVGTPTWFGFGEIDLSLAEIMEIGGKSALIHGAASLIVPILALSFLVKWRHIRRNLGFIYLSIAATMIPYIAIAFFNYEFPALVGGAVGLIFSVIFAKLGWGLDAAEGQSFEILNAGDGKHEGTADALGSESAGPESSAAAIGGRELIRATFPPWGTILILVLTRIPQLGIKALLNISEPAARIGLGSLGQFSISPALGLGLTGIFGTDVSWSHKLLYVPSIIPFGLISLFTFAWYRMDRRAAGRVFSESLAQMAAPAKALFGALVFVNLMMMGGDGSAVALIGGTLSAVTGGAWKYFAAFLGALGSFFSGSNTVSNLTFGAIQDSIASNLGLNRTTILALQSVGGAMGNMVCINNIVAVSSVLALQKSEGYILTRTVRALLAYGAVAALMAAFLA